MTTWSGLARRFTPVRFPFLLAVACFGTPALAHAQVTAVVVGTELRVTGDGAANEIRLLNSIDSLRIEIWVGNAFLVDRQRSLFTTIRIDAGGGNDSVSIDETAGVFTDTEITTILGGDGHDTISGGTGAETIEGGAGNDQIDPGRGNDTVRGDAGQDVVVWSGGLGFLQPADGNDAIDGGDGFDTLTVTGTGLTEVYGLAPNGQRLLLTRSGGAISLDLGTLEVIGLALLGGDDTFTAAPGLPDALSLQLNGGDGNDTIAGGPGNDTIHGDAGDDTLSGGAGNDNIFGGAGIDAIDGGAGNDYMGTGPGNDTVLGGVGNDQMTWEAIDGFDDFDGQDGTDKADLAGDAAVNDLFIVVGPATGGFVVNRSGTGEVACLQVEQFSISPRGGDDLVNVVDSVNGRFDSAVIELAEGNDVLHLPVLTGHVFTGGGDGTDTLTYHAGGLPVDLTPATISVGGTERVGHHTYEQISVDDSAGQLPQVTITSPTTNPSTTTAVPFMALGGTASDADGGVTSVTWVSNRGYSGTASGTTTWTIADVPILPGTNVITVSAHDASGNSSGDALTVHINALSYLLAEGATGAFFDLDVLLANPSTSPAPVTVTFLREAGAPIVQSLTLAPTSRHTIHVDDIPGLENAGGVSTIVSSTQGIALAVERTMFWDQTGYGSHGGTAVDGPRTRWLFAEGAEGFYNTFVLLANPGGAAPTSTVTLTFLREGSTPFTKVVNVPPASRVTVAANGIPELVGRAFSIVVDATSPIVAERAMYFGTARLFNGGHESTGVADGATSWFLAEGATGSFFTTFVLVGNPNATPAAVTLTFLTSTGQTVVRNKVVPANGRLTVNVALEDPILSDAAVATTVTANVPVVAERAMYWPGPPTSWAEAHNSFGTATLGTRWGLAEGRVGKASAFQTYILLAKPSATAADVRVTFLRTNGTTVVKSFTVAPTSRFNVDLNGVPELANEDFGALVEVLNGVGISVERAMYSNALGQFWAAGTNALGTRLP